MVMNLGSWLKECCPKYKRQGKNFCEEFTAWHLATKCAAMKFTKPWISSHFTQSKDPSYVGSAMCPECPGKDFPRQVMLATSTRKQHIGCPRTRWRAATPTLLCPSWRGASRNIWDCCWPWRAWVLLVLRAPASLPRGKAGMKIEWRDFSHTTINANPQGSLLLSPLSGI